jgi:succinate dehydrogenase / fumarate reductase cytochrome b subunit
MADRPLSPHLQIYKPIVTMVMSITHRITGAALYFGMAFIVWWLMAAALSERGFAEAQGFFAHWFGQLVLLGLAWALIHHTIGGIKHLLWDLGYAYGRGIIDWLAWGSLIASLILTAVVAVVGYSVLP